MTQYIYLENQSYIYTSNKFFFLVEDAGCDLGDYLSVTTAQALPKSDDKNNLADKVN